jgi:SAM-dependent methyltransferase
MSDAETLEEVRKAGRARLQPSLIDPNWLVLRHRRELFKRWLKRLPEDGLSVLDVGGRIQPYRTLLGAKCIRYTAVDIRITPLVDVVGLAQHLPVADQRFDLVFCTQVLEYLFEPQLAVNEIYRALKKDGFLFLSVPAVFPRDSESEYWRFLPGALKYLLSDFSSVEVAPEGNSLTGFIRTMNVCLLTFAKPAALRWLIGCTVVPMLNILGFFLQATIRSDDDRFTANFSVLAQK